METQKKYSFIRRNLLKIKLTRKDLSQVSLILTYLRPYRLQFSSGLIFIFLSSLTSMALPFLLKELIDSARGLSPKGFLHSGSRITIALIIALMLQTLFTFIRSYLFTLVGEKLLSDIRKDVYARMIMMSMNFFSQRRVGELSSRLNSDLSQIQNSITYLFAELIRGVLTILIGIALILFISVKLTLAMLAIVPLLAITAVFFSRRIRRGARETQDQLADTNIILHETLQGIANVKAFTNEWFEISRYGASMNKAIRLAIRNGKNRGLLSSGLMFGTFGTIVLIVSFGDLTAFVIYTVYVGGNIASFAELFSQLQRALGATQRVRELLDSIPESIENKNSTVESKNRLYGKINISNVSFYYSSRESVQVLDEVSIHIEPGSKVAIVGQSGAGKSTIAALLLRFYEPSKGNIFFDGRDAGSIPLSQLRKQIAVVPQEVFLFGGTILENIEYGKPGAPMSEVEKAARLAYAHEFIVEFPEGYNTVVGERGIKLSGGQRQRIAIARAILKDPVVLILDEATSALDAASEFIVQKALENLMRSRTSVIIAHRLSTIRSADQIVVLDKGRIQEKGTHAELAAKEDGLYRHLNRRQLD